MKRKLIKIFKEKKVCLKIEDRDLKERLKHLNTVDDCSKADYIIVKAGKENQEKENIIEVGTFKDYSLKRLFFKHSQVSFLQETYISSS